MNDHTRIRQNLSPYLDGALTPKERLEVEEHLKSCPACRQALDELEKTIANLRELPGAEPPPWLAAKIMARLREEQKPEKTIWQRLFFPLQVKLPLEAMALFAICVTGYFLSQNLLSSPEMQLARPVTEPQQTPPPRVEGPAMGGKPVQPPGGPVAPAPAGKPGIRSTPSPGKERQTPPRPQQDFAPAPPVPRSEDSKGSGPAVGHPADTARQPASEPALQEAPKAGGGSEQFRPVTPFLAPAPSALEVAPPARHGVAKKAKKAAKATEQQADGGAAPFADVQKGREPFILRVADPAAAQGALREAIAKAGGSLVRQESIVGGSRLTVRIPVPRLQELVARLDAIGDLTGKPAAAPESAGEAEIGIVVEAVRR